MMHADMIVSGIVQGVGFRYMVQMAAMQYSLKGEVENLEDMTVRISCEGEEDSITEFIRAVRNADSPMRVDDIQVEYSESRGKYKVFKIIFGDMLGEMAEGHATGAMYLRDIRDTQKVMLGKQDVMIEKQDQMIEKQDQTIAEIHSSTKMLSEKQDQTIAAIHSSTKMLSEKQDQMIEKQDQTNKEIRNMSTSNREMLDSRFEKLEREIAKIKTRLEI